MSPAKLLDPVSHLEVAEGVEARWDLSQTVVVQMDFTDGWDVS